VAAPESVAVSSDDQNGEPVNIKRNTAVILAAATVGALGIGGVVTANADNGPTPTNHVTTHDSQGDDQGDGETDDDATDTGPDVDPNEPGHQDASDAQEEADEKGDGDGEVPDAHEGTDGEVPDSQE